MEWCALLSAGRGGPRPVGGYLIHLSSPAGRGVPPFPRLPPFAGCPGAGNFADPETSPDVHFFLSNTSARPT